MPAEVTKGDGEEVRKLREEWDQLRKELQAARSNEDLDSAREKMRGRLAIWLVLLLSFVLVATYVYLMVLSLYFAVELYTEDLTALIPMVGTTLLTPLVGLIGAVTGFYFGGLTATQAATQSHKATQAATQQGLEQAPTQQAVTDVTEAAQAAAEAAAEAAQAAQAAQASPPQEQKPGDR